MQNCLLKQDFENSWRQPTNMLPTFFCPLEKLSDLRIIILGTIEDALINQLIVSRKPI